MLPPQRPKTSPQWALRTQYVFSTLRVRRPAAVASGCSRLTAATDNKTRRKRRSFVVLTRKQLFRHEPSDGTGQVSQPEAPGPYPQKRARGSLPMQPGYYSMRTRRAAEHVRASVEGHRVCQWSIMVPIRRTSEGNPIARGNTPLTQAIPILTI